MDQDLGKVDFDTLYRSVRWALDSGNQTHANAQAIQQATPDLTAVQLRKLEALISGWKKDELYRYPIGTTPVWVEVSKFLANELSKRAEGNRPSP